MRLSDSDRCLLQILCDGQFHSGTELAKSLAMSRSAVWKHLQGLGELGLELTAVSGKGYKLQRPLQLLHDERILAALDASVIALCQELQVHDVLPSTNRHLLEAAQQGAVSGTLCLAEYQSAGKGRRGRHWVSPFGHNVYLSLLWRYQCGLGALAGLSLAVGVAVIRALRRLGVTELGLKWPNDIYWGRHKLGGILIEMSGESGGPCHAVVGLGLNLYLPSDQATAIEQPWVDLSRIVGEQIGTQRNQLVAYLISELLPVIANFESTGLAAVIDEWRTLDCLSGETACLTIGEQTRHGIVRGIDDQGLLLLEIDGQIRNFASGEVSLKAL